MLIAQGRRDFLFGLGQGSTAFERLRGPKALYVGLHGHTPSSFPAADTGYLMAQARAWFDTYLRGAPATHPPTAVAVASERFAGAARWTTSLPRTSRTRDAARGTTRAADRDPRPDHGRPIETEYRPRRPLDLRRTVLAQRRGAADPTMAVSGAVIWWASRTPEGVRQELWGIALVYNLIRLEMERAAAEAGVPPTRISFTAATMHIVSELSWLRAQRLALGTIPSRLEP